MSDIRNQNVTARNPNSTFEERDGVLVCVKRALSDARRAHAAHAARKGWKVSRKWIKASAVKFPNFHVY